MRILLLANIDMGLYKFRKELIEELVKTNEVYVSCPDGPYYEKLSEIGCTMIPCDVMDRRGTNPITDMKLFRYYRSVIKRIRPKAVLTFTIKPNVYGGFACRLLGVPYFANVTGMGTTIENGGLLARISILLYKIGLSKASCVFFQNRENQTFFSDRQIVKGRTRLIPGSGVNLSMHSYEPYPSISDGIHFLFVGRIMKDKGIEELIRAMRMIHKERPDAVLDVVGFCDEDYSELLKNAEEESAIVYHGPQVDVHPFYQKCHCTVLPSYHEGMANVLLESSSTGRPVIASRIPGCRETFEEGVTGFGCDAKDTGSLADSIRKFLDLSQEQRALMGAAARKKMEKEFDRSIVIQAYLEEINGVKQ